MPGPIVCGIDKSQLAAKVARLGASLAESRGSRLLLLHVAEVKVPPPGSAFAYEKLQEAAQEEGTHLLQELKAQGIAPAAEERVEPGSPVVKLIEIAESEQADLLVVGSRGHGALKSAVLGSVSRELAAHAPCPVVVVPPDARVPASGA